MTYNTFNSPIPFFLYFFFSLSFLPPYLPLSSGNGSTADDGGGHPLGIDLGEFLKGIAGEDDDGDGNGNEEMEIAEMVSRAMSVAESVVYGDVDDPISPRSRPGSARPVSARPGSRASARHVL